MGNGLMWVSKKKVGDAKMHLWRNIVGDTRQESPSFFCIEHKASDISA